MIYRPFSRSEHYRELKRRQRRAAPQPPPSAPRAEIPLAGGHQGIKHGSEQRDAPDAAAAGDYGYANGFSPDHSARVAVSGAKLML